jgi:hypothetical protein
VEGIGEQYAIREVCVLGDDDQAVLTSVFPDFRIRTALPQIPDMLEGKGRRKPKGAGKVLVEEVTFHATFSTVK